MPEDERQPQDATEGMGDGTEQYRELVTDITPRRAKTEAAETDSESAAPRRAEHVEAARADVEAATTPEAKVGPEERVQAFFDDFNTEITDAQSDLYTHGEDSRWATRLEGMKNPIKRKKLYDYWHNTDSYVQTKPYDELSGDPAAQDQYVQEAGTQGNRWAKTRNRLHIRDRIEGRDGQFHQTKSAAESAQLDKLAAAAGQAAVDRLHLARSGEPLPDNPAGRDFIVDLYLWTDGADEAVRRQEKALAEADNDHARENYTQFLANAKRSRELIAGNAAKEYDLLNGNPAAIEELIRYRLMTRGPAATELQRATSGADEKGLFGKRAKADRVAHAYSGVDSAVAEVTRGYRASSEV